MNVIITKLPDSQGWQFQEVVRHSREANLGAKRPEGK